MGFSSGLPLALTGATLAVWMAESGVSLTKIGFFVLVGISYNLKFLWSPLLDRFSVPGFSRFWGKRRGWIMLSQLGIFAAMVGMAFTSDDTDLALVALFAILLAFMFA